MIAQTELDALHQWMDNQGSSVATAVFARLLAERELLVAEHRAAPPIIQSPDYGANLNDPVWLAHEAAWQAVEEFK